MATIKKKRVPSARAKAAAAKRLSDLDKKANKVERNKLMVRATYGDRATRRKASTMLSDLPKKK